MDSAVGESATGAATGAATGFIVGVVHCVLTIKVHIIMRVDSICEMNRILLFIGCLMIINY
jgi:hypothetical protein